MAKRPYLIAEVKTESPYGFQSDKSWDELFTLAEHFGDMVSIHSDARWGGSFELVSKAVKRTSKPILAKGIHASDKDVERAINLGANAVLVVGRIPAPDLLSNCLIEPQDIAQLKRFSTMLPKSQRIVWNSRDLSTGKTRSKGDFQKARELWSGWLCQASNISTPGDIEPRADAVLVGQDLETFTNLL